MYTGLNDFFRLIKKTQNPRRYEAENNELKQISNCEIKIKFIQVVIGERAGRTDSSFFNDKLKIPGNVRCNNRTDFARYAFIVNTLKKKRLR